ncbi:hypothetical protein [Streptomyces sp. NPDC059979]|uniref:hypothetical protein n=1 Tax=Streptomyces sp. NPDC059979 TaxID=3347021 RepID=UPI0036AAE161
MDRTPAPIPTNNPVEAYGRLLTVPAMTSWTADREATHAGDTAEYVALLAAVEGYVRSQRVPGDRWWSVWWRTRKVEKPYRRMVKGSKLTEQGAREARQVFAGHVAYMKTLPAQRQQQADRRDARRASIGAATAKALHKSAAAAAPVPEAPAAEHQPQQGAQVRGISELWDRRRGA